MKPMMKLAAWTLVAGIALAGAQTWGGEKEGQEDKPTAERKAQTIEEAMDEACSQCGFEEDDIAEILSFYKQNFPERIQFLKDELNDDPEDTDEAVDIIASDLEMCNDLLEIEEDSPENFKAELEYAKLDIKTELMGEKIQDMRDKSPTENKKEIESLEGELEKDLNKLFSMKLALEKKGLRELEQEVEKLKQRIREREEKQDKIIRRRFDQLTGAEEDLEF